MGQYISRLRTKKENLKGDRANKTFIGVTKEQYKIILKDPEKQSSGIHYIVYDDDGNRLQK